ncbi:amino acid transporter, transmembrane domain-containing protein [Artemisia annua]|uniref:Amino acid transporter, transmembrane domain-containing protein n=1 Tax=Artemisia annua TaxID=35608 RepID=A0A2U1NGJ9_ARTAN|nr:amino acid transporter, transmembrane domain-containing protein [Artemisia annua]
MSEQENVTIESLSIESTGPTKGCAGLENGLASAHTIDHDSWGQLGLLLVTSFNCGYILSFSNLMLVPLGWTWGITSLILVGLVTAYANWLLAEFHFIDERRFIRYRDLMGYLFGREMYYLTWVLQFTILLLGNMGFLLLGGRALKEINSEFSDSPLRLQIYIVITGAAYFVFAFLVPTVSSMRRWLGISVVLTFTYIVILLVIVVRDGKCYVYLIYEV